MSDPLVYTGRAALLEAIILAGGLGTRLREAIPDLPKVLAPVNGRPFISYVIDHLRLQGVTRFIFSLGYKHEQVEDYLKQQYSTLDYEVVIEDEPLGTGGGIRLAMEKTTCDNVIVANGDTLFKVNLQELLELHNAKNAMCTLALKPLENFDRYGVVEVSSTNQVTSFKEKSYYSRGLINGGVFVLNKPDFMKKMNAVKFSFETDFLEKFVDEGLFTGVVQDAYFIDIGVPEDYSKAERDLLKPALDLSAVDDGWTLFLDRDGVINDERVGQYVLEWKQFVFSKGVLDAFKIFSDHFKRIIVVSNQRGVGKGLMTKETLDSIHYEMQREVRIVGAHIDKIYYCTDTDDRSFYRKPNPGMALSALKDFPELDLSKSIMVGNKPSDMKFGRAAGMYTVFLSTTNPDQQFPHADIDMKFESLHHFAEALQKHS